MTPHTDTRQSHGRVDAILREAAEWRLLSLLFDCPSPSWREDVTAVAHEVADEELRGVAERAAAHASEGLYHSLFGPGGPAPPREASYHEGLELGSLLSDLTGYYDAFGYRPASGETPDHVSVEVGFLAYLRLKQAYAILCGDVAHERAAADAATLFSTAHLSTITTRLADLLVHSGVEYLADASRIVAKRVGPGPVRRRLPVIPVAPIDDESGSAFDCGDAAGG
jgi:nitrate reductase assembly molybdenum cofactor insertion protein NarJ